MSNQHTLIPNATIQRSEKSRRNSPGKTDAASSHHRWSGRGTLPCSLNYQPPVDLRAIIIFTAAATDFISAAATDFVSAAATDSVSAATTASAAATSAEVFSR